MSSRARAGAERAERLAGAGRRARARRAARRRPRAARRLRADEMANLRWLTGFTGTSGVCLVGAERARLRDRLPLRRARRDARSPAASSASRAERQLLPARRRARCSGRVGFDDAHDQRRAACAKLEEAVPRTASSWCRPAGSSSSCAGTRTTASSRRSPRRRELADEVYEWLAERGLAGRSEREVARAAEARMRELGAEPVVPADRRRGPERRPAARRALASARSARASWSSSTWARASTATARTAPAPSPPASSSDEAREVYELVLERAGRGARRRSAPGSSGSEADAAARDLIAAAGHGEHFGHGLGHGVGLEVHEAPRLGPALRGRARGRRRGHGRAGRLRPGPLRRPDRGPGRRHRRRPSQPELAAEGPAGRPLQHLGFGPPAAARARA